MSNIGELIQEKRIAHGLKIEDVENALKIRKSYIIAIEKNQVEYFASKAYYYGYMKQYLRFIGIKDIELKVDMFDKEQELAINIPIIEQFNPSFTFAVIALILSIIFYNLCSNFIDQPIVIGMHHAG